MSMSLTGSDQVKIAVEKFESHVHPGVDPAICMATIAAAYGISVIAMEQHIEAKRLTKFVESNIGSIKVVGSKPFVATNAQRVAAITALIENLDLSYPAAYDYITELYDIAPERIWLHEATTTPRQAILSPWRPSTDPTVRANFLRIAVESMS